MKRLKLYIDTSVLGGIFDTEDVRRVNTAKSLINLLKEGLIFEGFISFLTIEEILKAPENIRGSLTGIIADSGMKILEETVECIELANTYVSNEIIPEKYRDDARHIAIAVFYEVDFVVSWNYRHMVNITVRRLVNSTNLKMGYKPIEIVSPEEVIGYYGEMEI